MSFLGKIIERKREEIGESSRRLPLEEIRERLKDAPSVRTGSFRQALTVGEKVALIGEIKKASPSKGLIRPDFDPAALASAYARGGASALSVLTDIEFFQGRNEYLALARQASGLPVLRKDFIIDRWQLYESRLLGADCILLIVAALEDPALIDLAALAGELGLEVLVEVHDEKELERALTCRPDMIGVNNRDLDTFEVSLEVSRKLAPLFPEETVRVSESGITDGNDLRELSALGYHAVLVGEHLMRQPDLEQAVRTLLQGV